MTGTEWLEGGVLGKKEAPRMGSTSRPEGPKGTNSILQAFYRSGDLKG